MPDGQKSAMASGQAESDLPKAAQGMTIPKSVLQRKDLRPPKKNAGVGGGKILKGKVAKDGEPKALSALGKILKSGTQATDPSKAKELQAKGPKKINKEMPFKPPSSPKLVAGKRPTKPSPSPKIKTHPSVKPAPQTHREHKPPETQRKSNEKTSAKVAPKTSVKLEDSSSDSLEDMLQTKGSLKALPPSQKLSMAKSFMKRVLTLGRSETGAEAGSLARRRSSASSEEHLGLMRKRSRVMQKLAPELVAFQGSSPFAQEDSDSEPSPGLPTNRLGENLGLSRFDEDFEVPDLPPLALGSRKKSHPTDRSRKTEPVVELAPKGPPPIRRASSSSSSDSIRRSPRVPSPNTKKTFPQLPLLSPKTKEAKASCRKLVHIMKHRDDPRSVKTPPELLENFFARTAEALPSRTPSVSPAAPSTVVVYKDRNLGPGASKIKKDQFAAFLGAQSPRSATMVKSDALLPSKSDAHPRKDSPPTPSLKKPSDDRSSETSSILERARSGRLSAKDAVEWRSLQEEIIQRQKEEERLQEEEEERRIDMMQREAAARALKREEEEERRAPLPGNIARQSELETVSLGQLAEGERRKAQEAEANLRQEDMERRRKEEEAEEKRRSEEAAKAFLAEETNLRRSAENALRLKEGAEQALREEEQRRLAEATRQQEEEAAQKKRELGRLEAQMKQEEDEARKRREEESEKIRAEQEARRRREEEIEALRRQDEAECIRKEVDEQRARQEQEEQRKQEEEKRQRMMKEEKRAEEEARKRREEEEAEQRRIEEAEKRRKEAELEDEKRAAEAARLKEEEELRRKLAEEARKAEAEAKRRKAEAEERRQRAEQLAKQALEEERRRREEEAELRRMEEAEAAAALRKIEELEEHRKRLEAVEAERRRQLEEEREDHRRRLRELQAAQEEMLREKERDLARQREQEKAERDSRQKEVEMLEKQLFRAAKEPTRAEAKEEALRARAQDLAKKIGSLDAAKAFLLDKAFPPKSPLALKQPPQPPNSKTLKLKKKPVDVTRKSSEEMLAKLPKLAARKKSLPIEDTAKEAPFKEGRKPPLQLSPEKLPVDEPQVARRDSASPKHMMSVGFDGPARDEGRKEARQGKVVSLDSFKSPEAESLLREIEAIRDALRAQAEQTPKSEEEKKGLSRQIRELEEELREERLRRRKDEERAALALRDAVAAVEKRWKSVQEDAALNRQQIVQGARRSLRVGRALQELAHVLERAAARQLKSTFHLLKALTQRQGTLLQRAEKPLRRMANIVRNAVLRNVTGAFYQLHLVGQLNHILQPYEFPPLPTHPQRPPLNLVVLPQQPQDSSGTNRLRELLADNVDMTRPSRKARLGPRSKWTWHEAGSPPTFAAMRSSHQILLERTNRLLCF